LIAVKKQSLDSTTRKCWRSHTLARTQRQATASAPPPKTATHCQSLEPTRQDHRRSEPGRGEPHQPAAGAQLDAACARQSDVAAPRQRLEQRAHHVGAVPDGRAHAHLARARLLQQRRVLLHQHARGVRGGGGCVGGGAATLQGHGHEVGRLRLGSVDARERAAHRLPVDGVPALYHDSHFGPSKARATVRLCSGGGRRPTATAGAQLSGLVAAWGSKAFARFWFVQ
jgi:hypothetical protein